MNMPVLTHLLARALYVMVWTFALTVVSGCGGGGGGGGASPLPPLGDVNIPPPENSNGRNFRTTEYRNNYGVDSINADYAYQRGYFGQGVTVAVVDTGLRTTHSDIGNIVSGRDFVFPGTAVRDPHGHGTNVAGVIAARLNNVGMHGVAPLARIMPLKIGDSAGRLVGSVREAFRHAAAQNVHIVNNSFSDVGETIVGTYGSGRTIYQTTVPFFHQFVKDNDRNFAREVAGIVRNEDMVMVFAAGNSGWQPTTGRVRLRPGCDDLRRNCVSETGAFNIGFLDMRQNFNSLDYIDPDGNSVAGEGRLVTLAGSDVPLSSYYSSLPLWAVDNIDSILNDLDTGVLSEDEFANRLIGDSNFIALSRRWLAVVSTDSNNIISSFSNGCGLALIWCLAAPGRDIYTTDRGSDSNYNTVSGTSFSAPHVSGALAVLKSRLPAMRMEVLVAILLNTATDLGASGVDNIYGWGLVNLEDAIKFQGQISFASSSASAESPRLQNARAVLPAGLAHVKERLRSVEVALEMPGGLYYNMPLADIVHTPAAPSANLGDAASDMLSPLLGVRANAGGVFAAVDSKTGQFRYAGADVDGGALGLWRVRHDFCDDCKESAWQEWNALNDEHDVAVAPFFARNNERAVVLQMRGGGVRPFAAFGGESNSRYRQIGLRWQREHGAFGVLAEASHIDEEGSFMGADFGVLGKIGTQTQQGRVAMHGNLAENWRGFMQYEHALGDADVKSDGFLSGVSNVRSAGWAAGLERRNMFLGGDRIRILARQDTTIRSGRAQFRLARADGDLSSALYRSAGLSSEQGEQTLREYDAEVDLSSSGPVLFSLGYAMQLSDKSELALGAERYGKESAVSAHLQMEF